MTLRISADNRYGSQTVLPIMSWAEDVGDFTERSVRRLWDRVLYRWPERSW